MKIVLMSDSHGNSNAIKDVILANRDADYFYHLGDVCDDPEKFGNVTFIKGNNDFWYDLPDNIIAHFGSFSVYMTHSHRLYGYGVSRKHALAKLAKDNGCNMIWYGHTHVYDDTSSSGVRILNPGSLYYNRDYSDPCYMVIEINENNVKITRKTL